MEKEKKQHSFEEAYARLEEILELLNSGKIPLEKSIKLYEEADQLIISCSKRLTSAEQKIQKLMQNRDGDLALNSDGSPQVEPFSPQNNSLLNS